MFLRFCCALNFFAESQKSAVCIDVTQFSGFMQLVQFGLARCGMWWCVNDALRQTTVGVFEAILVLYRQIRRAYGIARQKFPSYVGEGAGRFHHQTPHSSPSLMSLLLPAQFFHFMQPPSPDTQPQEVAPNIWRVLDPGHGRYYYYNRTTGETSWYPPPGVPDAAPPPADPSAPVEGSSAAARGPTEPADPGASGTHAGADDGGTRRELNSSGGGHSERTGEEARERRRGHENRSHGGKWKETSHRPGLEQPVVAPHKGAAAPVGDDTRPHVGVARCIDGMRAGLRLGGMSSPSSLQWHKVPRERKGAQGGKDRPGMEREGIRW